MASEQKLQVKRVRCTKDLLPQLAKALEDVLNLEVLVGIPAKNAERNEVAGQDVNNAVLGYIHEFGSPAQNIPARPFLIPGVEKAEDQIAEQLRKALKSACAMDGSSGRTNVEAAGMVASSSAKREVGENGPPLKAATIRNRRHSRNTKSTRESEKRYLRLLAQGMSEAEAQEAAGVRQLVNTGQMRNAITYVVRPRPRPIKIPLRKLGRATTPSIPKGKA